MKRSANLETIVDVLNYGTRNKRSKTVVMNNLGLPAGIGKPLLDELANKGLMKKREDEAFVTTQRGYQYLHDLEELNKLYGIDSVIEALSEAKRRYYKSRKLTTS